MKAGESVDREGGEEEVIQGKKKHTAKGFIALTYFFEALVVSLLG